ncbi:MAG: UDP-2,4-diacetamido-2,4,6-trideoxy-beta-L-altropyranose hydrolase [Acetatifactor sp.]|nr:UDP-2,4-diacetamido-2,4,6-trideoxy-beta-L-altropyranose hydrolase [Acetatifactor sp.]
MIFIRADGGPEIGIGHLMRCMTLARELASRQDDRENICFVCADQGGADFAKGQGFPARILGTRYQDMESELPLWSRILEETREKKEPGSFLILADSYFVTEKYLAALKNLAYTALMDDMGTERYPVDCLINYNLTADFEAYERLYEGQNTDLIIGSRYAPVRRQFLNVDYQMREQVKSVLITTGGGDIENIAGQIWRTINTEDYEFHLVTGRFNPHFQELKRLEEGCRNLHIHHDVADMAGLMKMCDMAITAGGSTVYELAAVGVPFICFSYAENQEEQARCMAQRRIAPYAGAYHRSPGETLVRIRELFQQTASDPKERRTIHENEKNLTDGKGAARLAEELVRLAGRRK